VEFNGNTYYGNQFSGAYSTTGGSNDRVNNVESVFFPAGTTGTVTITVSAYNIPSDGVPGNDEDTDQDWALVIRNAVPTSVDFILTQDDVDVVCDETGSEGFYFTLSVNAHSPPINITVEFDSDDFASITPETHSFTLTAENPEDAVSVYAVIANSVECGGDAMFHFTATLSDETTQTGGRAVTRIARDALTTCGIRGEEDFDDSTVRKTNHYTFFFFGICFFFC
jgi:hypothetical protein